MLRRDFLTSYGSRGARCRHRRARPFAQSEESVWRTYEVTTSVRVLKPSGRTRIWLPQPLADNTGFQKLISSFVQCDGGRTSIHEDRRAGMKMLMADFPADRLPVLATTQRISTRNWSVDLESPSQATHHAVSHDVARFLQPTRYVPTDGIVKETAEKITKGATTDVEKARAIYEWIVENTYRNPKVRGCGRGDIRPMLEMRRPRRQVRGSQRTLCRPGESIRHSCTRRLWHSNRPVEFGVEVSGHIVGPCRESSALPRRSISLGLRLGSDGPGRCSQGHSRGAPGQSRHHRQQSRSRAKTALRIVGDELDGVQLRAGRSAAGSSGPSLPFLMYPQAETEEGRLDSSRRG